LIRDHKKPGKKENERGFGKLKKEGMAVHNHYKEKFQTTVVNEKFKINFAKKFENTIYFI